MRLDVLRCRSPQMIRKELLMHWIAYNLVRAVMLQAALCYQVALYQFQIKEIVYLGLAWEVLLAEFRANRWAVTRLRSSGSSRSRKAI
jgi:hypothetical protein